MRLVTNIEIKIPGKVINSQIVVSVKSIAVLLVWKSP